MSARAKTKTGDASRLPKPGQRRGTLPWAQYEARKAGWLVLHPEATSAEYEAAMIRIARECGV